MTGFLGFSERLNFGRALYPVIPMGDVQNFNLMPVDQFQPQLGLPFSAWSCARRIYSQYTGNLIEVRRSSDNATQNIGYGADNELDQATLLGFVGAGSGFVRTLYDQSGGGRDFTQTTIANQPRIVNAGVVDLRNNKPSMFFDGTNHSMAVASSTASYNWLHNSTDAESEAIVLSVCQFGTVANPAATYTLIANNGIASANIGFSFYYEDTSGLNDAIAVTTSRGVSGTLVCAYQSSNQVTPNQLNAFSANTNRGLFIAGRGLGFVNQNNPTNTNSFTGAPVNTNASFNLSLGISGGAIPYRLRGYVSELYLYRQSTGGYRNLSIYNAALQSFYGIT